MVSTNLRKFGMDEEFRLRYLTEVYRVETGLIVRDLYKRAKRDSMLDRPHYISLALLVHRHMLSMGLFPR